MGKIKNYYAGANSSMGFYSLYEEAFKGLEKLYILKGGPGTGKSTLMRKVGLACMEQGLDLEYYHCSSDNMSLDGVIVPTLGIGLVDGTAPHIVEPKYPGIIEEVVNLGEFRDDTVLVKNKAEIISLIDDNSNCFRAAYKTFAMAKEIHLKKEAIYEKAMDFSKANIVTDRLLQEIFSPSFEKDQEPRVRKLFFGAATPKGPKNFIDNITEDMNKRYIIKGRPGSGKSTLMKKIGKRAEHEGLSVEYFMCGFDPNSVDMVLIPSLHVCLVDGTAPHVVEAYRQNDEIVDMFQECIDPTIEKGKTGEELEVLDVSYKSLMQEATNYLSEAKRLHEMVEEYYKNAMDFNKVSKKRDEIIKEILH